MTEAVSGASDYVDPLKPYCFLCTNTAEEVLDLLNAISHSIKPRTSLAEK